MPEAARRRRPSDRRTGTRPLDRRLADARVLGIKLGLDTHPRAGRRARPSRARLPPRHRRRHQRQGIGHRDGGARTAGRRTARRPLHVAAPGAAGGTDCHRRRRGRQRRLRPRHRGRLRRRGRCLADGRLAGPATYFEATTAVACDLLRRARVDVAVIEVGLGGRHDATNVCEPVATAITSIDLDHRRSSATRRRRSQRRRPSSRPAAPRRRRSRRRGARRGRRRRRLGQGAARLCLGRRGVRDRRHRRGTRRLRSTPRRGPTARCASPSRRSPGRQRRRRRGLLEALEFAGIDVDRRAVKTGLADASWPGRLDRGARPTDGARCSTAPTTLPAPSARSLARAHDVGRAADARHGVPRQGRRRPDPRAAAGRRASSSPRSRTREPPRPMRSRSRSGPRSLRPGAARNASTSRRRRPPRSRRRGGSHATSSSPARCSWSARVSAPRPAGPFAAGPFEADHDGLDRAEPES